jgi:hypothetical protein
MRSRTRRRSSTSSGGATLKTAEALLFEAKQTELFVEPNLVPIGTQSIERWKTIANAYLKPGTVSEAELPPGMIYLPDDAGLLDWLKSAPLAWALHRRSASNSAS